MPREERRIHADLQRFGGFFNQMQLYISITVYLYNLEKSGYRWIYEKS